MGAVAGGLEALVLRPVASGLRAWIKWSAFACAGLGLLVTGAALLPGRGPSGEVVSEGLSFAAAVIIALLTLPALAALQPQASS
jgi:hypothetical protein